MFDSKNKTRSYNRKTFYTIIGKPDTQKKLIYKLVKGEDVRG